MDGLIEGDGYLLWIVAEFSRFPMRMLGNEIANGETIILAGERLYSKSWLHFFTIKIYIVNIEPNYVSSVK